MASQPYFRARGLSQDAEQAQALLYRYQDITERELAVLVRTFANLPLLDFGLLAADQRLGAQLDAFYADPWSFRMHGGENDRDVLERAWPAIERALVPGESIAAVTHYNVIRVVASHLLGIQPGRSFRLRVDTGGVVLLARSASGWCLLRSNVCAPRPEDALTEA